MNGQNLTSIDERPPSNRLDTFAWVVCNRVTHQLAMWSGRFFPGLLVAEHPRSGGTWLAHMLVDYLQIPFPKYRRRPITFEAIVHTHLPYSTRLNRGVFIKRDGRDLVVSSYFKTLKEIGQLPMEHPSRRKHLGRYPSLAGATGEFEDTRARLPQFIAEWWRRPPGCRINWLEYSSAWLNNNGSVVVTSYENLRSNCELELMGVIKRLSPNPVDGLRLKATVNRYSFQLQTGRQPGDENRDSNKRKGLVGDWRNYFTAAAAQQFDSLAGPGLIMLGYEADAAWVSTC